MNGNVKSLGFRFAFAWHTKRPIYPDWEKCPMSELFSIEKWGNLLDVIDHSLKPKKKKKSLKRTIKIYHDQVVEVHFDWWYSCFYFRKYFAVPLRLREMCDRFFTFIDSPTQCIEFPWWHLFQNWNRAWSKVLYICCDGKGFEYKFLFKWRIINWFLLYLFITFFYGVS